MFSALRQGSVVYILEKGEKLSSKIGQVVSVSSPQFTSGVFPNNNQQFGGVVNITVNINGEKIDFSNLPAAQNITNYNNGSLIISESRDAIIAEVDNMIRNSQSILDSIDYHKSVIVNGEEVLKSLNPQFAKEKARDEEIDALNRRMDVFGNTLDKIVNILSKAENK